MGIKFDLIIANPPYGKPGANITKNIIDNVYFEEYVNLLPANDYKRNDSKDLFKYAREMESINNGFKDAAVTTHLCRIAKEANNMTVDEFEISNYIDKSLNKYFVETRNRSHYAIDSAFRPHFNTLKPATTVNNTCLIGIRDISAQHLPFRKNVSSYNWNINKSITLTDLINAIGKTGSPNTQFSHYFITFNTEAERDNFAKFMYSKNGFRFFSKIFTAVNVDSMIALGKVLPKVDWTRSWTVEEILKDYGYTDLEIENIMADLDNFKGMDD